MLQGQIYQVGKIPKFGRDTLTLLVVGQVQLEQIGEVSKLWGDRPA